MMFNELMNLMSNLMNKWLLNSFKITFIATMEIVPNNSQYYQIIQSKQLLTQSLNSIGPNLGIKIVSKSVTLYHLPTPERQ